MKLSTKRMEELLNNCIEYIWGVKDCGSYEEEELKDFWSDVIGLTDEEIKYYSLI